MSHQTGYLPPDFDGFNCKHRYLYHYTDEEGYNGILSSLSIRPSTLSGVKTTHYGQGVYFTPIGPAEIPILGIPEFLQLVFGDVTAHSVTRTTHYISVRVDPNWYAMAARDPEYGWWMKDIWIVPGDEPMDISKALDSHGKTVIGENVDAMANRATATRDYAFALTHRQEEPPQARLTWTPRPMVMIGGQLVKRPEGWYEDAPYWWVPPGQ
jgi:ADP-ribosyltransferase of polymorphic toxin system